MRANLEPEIWGPSGWAFLSSCVTACDEASRSDYLALLRLLPAVLPCSSCRHHAAEYISAHPPEKSAHLGDWL